MTFRLYTTNLICFIYALLVISSCILCNNNHLLPLDSDLFHEPFISLRNSFACVPNVNSGTLESSPLVDMIQNEHDHFHNEVMDAYFIEDSIFCINFTFPIRNVYSSNKNLFYLSINGSLWMSGTNQFGQLGINDTLYNFPPYYDFVPLLNFSVREVCPLDESTIIITNSNKMYSSGRNQYGQLGLGFGTMKDGTEKKITTFHEIFFRYNVSLAFSSFQCGKHSAYLLAEGKIFSWGRNDMYQLGDGTQLNQYLPKLMTFFSDAALDISILSIGFHEAFALDEYGVLWAWGRGYSGQLGLFVDQHWRDYNQDLPMRVAFPGNETIANIAAGDGFLLVLSNSGNVYGVGSNTFGQLGISADVDTLQIQMVYSTTSEVYNVFAGEKNSFLIMNDGSLWMSGSFEIFGNDSSMNRFSFEKLNSTLRFRHVATGNSFLTLSGDLCGAVLENSPKVCGGHGYCGYSDATYCACEKGYSNQFNATNNLDDFCVLCPPGYYSVANDTFNEVTDCLPCPVNTYNPIFGASSLNACIPCPQGYIAESSANSNASHCIKCPTGTYAAADLEAGFAKCLKCPTGTWSNISGSFRLEDCTPCPSGTYQPLEGQSTSSSCIKCPKGTWNPYSNSSSLSDCIECPPGTFSDIDGAYLESTCEPCPLGKYSDTSSASSCKSCPPYLLTFSIGATDVVNCSYCDLGFYSIYDAENDISHCVACYIGSFSVTENATNPDACEPCPGGSYSEVIGNTNPSCIECPIQTYSLGNASSCTDCPLGTYSVKGASECMSCPPGKILIVPLEEVTEDSDVNCGYCDAGTWTLISPNGQTECIPCPMGTYSSIVGAANNSLCLPCPEGTFSELAGQTSLDSCILCPIGTWSNISAATSRTTCKKCPKGTYSDEEGNDDINSCIACPAGMYSDAEGATSFNTCKECIAGYASNVEGASDITFCEICPAQTYSSAGSAECTPCPDGYFTNSSLDDGRGKTSIDDCTACGVGWYFQLDTEECEACPAGTYSNVPAASSVNACKKCPLGSYSDTPGSQACKKCPKGSWSSVAAATSINDCQYCPEGTYSDVLGASSSATCLTCPLGYYQEYSGSSHCNPCPLGTYSETLKSTSSYNCIPCDKGYYSSTLAGNSSSVCEQCPEGTYNPFTGMTSISDCILCPPGTYNLNNASTSINHCLGCPHDSYNPYTGANQCIDCPSNLITDCQNVVGAAECMSRLGVYDSLASCRECDAGSYMTETETKKVCELCKPGYYSERVGMISNTTCQPCPKGTYMSVSDFPLGGATSFTYCLSCPSGTYNENIASVGISSCQVCPTGTYSSLGSSKCTNCSAGTASSVLGSTSSRTCMACPAGTWSESGYTFCESCLPGYYNPEIGSTNITACIPCPKGTANGEYRATSPEQCITCIAGTYARNEGSSACISCEAGTISQTNGSISCETCPRGTFAIEASSECTPCNVGTYSNELGARSRSACLLCPINTYNSEPGSTGCSSCPSDHLCPKGSSSLLPDLIFLQLEDQRIFSPSVVLDSTIYTWIRWSLISFLIILFIIILILVLICSCCTDQGVFLKILQQCDILFNMTHENKIGEASDKVKTRLGGLCSITAIFGFLIVIVIIVTDAFFFNVRINHTFKLVDSSESIIEDSSNVFSDPSYGQYRSSISIVGSLPYCRIIEKANATIESGIWIEMENIQSDSSDPESGISTKCELRDVLAGELVRNCYCEIVCTRCKLVGISQTVTFSASKEFATRFAYELEVPHYVLLSPEVRAPFLLNGTVIAPDDHVFFGTNPVELYISTFETQSITTPNYILGSFGQKGTTRKGLTSQLLTISHGDSPSVDEAGSVLYDSDDAGLVIRFSLSRSNLAFIEEEVLNQSFLIIIANLASLIGAIYTITGFIMTRYEKCIIRMRSGIALAKRGKHYIVSSLNKEKTHTIEKIPRNKFKEQTPWGFSEITVPTAFESDDPLPIESSPEEPHSEVPKPAVMDIQDEFAKQSPWDYVGVPQPTNLSDDPLPFDVPNAPAVPSMEIVPTESNSDKAVLHSPRRREVQNAMKRDQQAVPKSKSIEPIVRKSHSIKPKSSKQNEKAMRKKLERNSKAQGKVNSLSNSNSLVNITPSDEHAERVKHMNDPDNANDIIKKENSLLNDIDNLNDMTKNGDVGLNDIDDPWSLLPKLKKVEEPPPELLEEKNVMQLNTLAKKVSDTNKEVVPPEDINDVDWSKIADLDEATLDLVLHSPPFK